MRRLSLRSLILVSIAVLISAIVALLFAGEIWSYQIASYVAGGLLVIWIGLFVLAVMRHRWRGLHLLWPVPVAFVIVGFIGTPLCACGQFETLGSSVSSVQMPGH